MPHSPCCPCSYTCYTLLATPLPYHTFICATLTMLSLFLYMLHPTHHTSIPSHLHMCHTHHAVPAPIYATPLLTTPLTYHTLIYATLTMLSLLLYMLHPYSPHLYPITPSYVPHSPCCPCSYICHTPTHYTSNLSHPHICHTHHAVPAPIYATPLLTIPLSHHTFICATLTMLSLLLYMPHPYSPHL